MSDNTTILCSPITCCRPVTGAIVVSCLKCQTKVWFAPSSQQMLMKNPNTRIVCIPCGMAENPTNIQPITPEQIEEIERELNQ